MNFKKIGISLLIVLVSLPSIQMFADPEVGSSYELKQLFAYNRIVSVVPSPDKKQVAFISNYMKNSSSGQRWEYALYIKNSKGKIKLLIRTEAISSIEWSDDGETITYLSKDNGLQSIFVLDLKTRKSTKLFEFGNNIEAFKWSPNRRFIAFISKDVNPVPVDSLKAIDVDRDYANSRLYVYEVDAKSKIKITALTSEQYSVTSFSSYGAFDWSPDSQSIAFSYQPRSGAAYELENKIGIVTIGSLAVRSIDYSASRNCIQPTFSPDGKWIAFQSSLSEEEALKKFSDMQSKINSPALLIKGLVTKICVYNIGSKEAYCLSNTFNEMPTLIGWNHASDRVFVWDAYKSTGYQIYSLSLDPAVPASNISQVDGFISPITIRLNNTGTQFGFGYETVSKSPEAFISDTDPFKLLQVSRFKREETKSLGSFENLAWKSTDGTDIQGFLIKPANFDAKNTYPLFVSLHGGPSGRWNKRFLRGCDEYGETVDPTTCFQNILNLGFVILQPNPRGSTGFGSDFRMANFSDLGGKDYQDIMTGVDHLIEKKIVDPEHLAVGGWSYGGYMTAWIISQTNRFKAAIEGDGFTNFTSMSGTSDNPDFLSAYLGSPFWNNNKLYLERSPISFTQNITTPLLIIHGENDPRVPLKQGNELYNALKKQNKPVKMLILPNQGHLPTDANLILESIKAIEVWLKKAL